MNFIEVLPFNFEMALNIERKNFTKIFIHPWVMNIFKSIGVTN